MDGIRKKTDKRLKSMERRMGRVYKTYPALLAIEKEYRAYMDTVAEKTRDSYNAFIHADEEEKAEKKKAYGDEVKALTLDSRDYQKIVRKFVRAMAKANQEALEIANAEMRKIYVENYNQVAEECRRVGIKVYGEEEK